MSSVRAGGSAQRRGGSGRGKRIRFREAVPLWRDRRDLSRQFRRASRAVTVEQRAETTALLLRLSTDQIPLSEVMPGPRPREGVIEFSNGTQLLLVTRYGGAGMRRLRERYCASLVPVWLVRVQPSFARRRFRLWFASADRAVLAEVAAKVGPAPAGH
jgi:hypothetical protein